MTIAAILLVTPIDVAALRIVEEHTRLFPSATPPSEALAKPGLRALRTAEGFEQFVTFVPTMVDLQAALPPIRFAATDVGRDFYAACQAHKAHIVVATKDAEAGAVAQAQAQTRLIASVCASVGQAALAVYDGDACATYPAPYYVSTASSKPLPIALWTGISAGAGPEDGRLSYVSLGMKRFGFPNVMVAAPRSREGDAWGMLSGLCAYMIENGPFSPEDTVNDDDGSDLAFTLVPSPVFPSETVFRVDLPDAR